MPRCSPEASRYLPPTKLDFFSQDILCKFLFSPCNQSKILLGYFVENIFSIYIFEPISYRSSCNISYIIYVIDEQSTCSVSSLYSCFLVSFLSSQSNSEDFSAEDERLGYLALGVKKVG